MAFDCSDVPPPPPPPRAPPPAPPKVGKRDEAVLLGLLVLFALGCLVVPISASALIDVVRWLHSGA